MAELKKGPIEEVCVYAEGKGLYTVAHWVWGGGVGTDPVPRDEAMEAMTGDFGLSHRQAEKLIKMADLEGPYRGPFFPPEEELALHDELNQS